MDNATLHTYCVMKISQNKLSQTALAAICGCTVQTINQIITGRKKSARIQAVIAQYLDHSSWEELEKTSEIFGSFVFKADEKIKEITPDRKTTRNKRRIS